MPLTGHREGQGPYNKKKKRVPRGPRLFPFVGGCYTICPVVDIDYLKSELRIRAFENRLRALHDIIVRLGPLVLYVRSVLSN